MKMVGAVWVSAGEKAIRLKQRQSMKMIGASCICRRKKRINDMEEERLVVLVIGESGSGKSEYAEDYLAFLGKGGEAKKYYLATMKPYGREAAERIARHRTMREGKEFQTVERYTDVGDCSMEEGSSVLVESISNLLANEMFPEEGESGQEKPSRDRLCRKICSDIKKLIDQTENCVIVTDDVFADGAVYDSGTEEYMRALGEINRNLADISDQCVEVVYSCPVFLKR